MPGTSQRLDVSTAIPVRVAPRRSRSASKGRRGAMPRPLDQAVFRGALLRERQQADRFESDFGLVLVLPRQQGSTMRHAAAVLSALEAAGHDTDVHGWYEQNVVAGAVRWRRDGVESVAA